MKITWTLGVGLWGLMVGIVIPSFADLTDGLVGHWTFEEGQGTTVYDQTQVNGPGILMGNASWTSGHTGGGLSFNGSTGYLKVARVPALANLNRFSLSVWTKITGSGSAAYQEILERGSAYHMGGTFSLFYSVASQQFIFSFYRLEDGEHHSTYARSPHNWTPSEWHHIAVTSDGATVRVYLDGLSGRPITVSMVDPLEDGLGDTNYAKAMYVGAEIYQTADPTDFLNGSVDEIRFYNRELSFSEIVALYGSEPITSMDPIRLSSSTTPFPHLYGKVGPYAYMTAQDVRDIAASGFNLVLGGYQNPSSTIGPILGAHHMSQIVGITGRLYQVCPPNPESGTCPISPEDEQSILDHARTIINASAQDPTVVGYWILDDSPGDVPHIIQGFHDLIAESNQTAVFPRAAICGFGGRLDYKMSLDAPFYYPGGVSGKSLVNYSPTACDVVALYLYGAAPADDPRLVDWTMTYVLPDVLQAFRSKGWNPAKQPFMALPHAFSLLASKSGETQYYYVLPRAMDVATQSENYCRGGAISLLPYCWHTSPSGSTHALWDTPDLVRGLQQGQDICQRRYWYPSPFSSDEQAPSHVQFVPFKNYFNPLKETLRIRFTVTGNANDVTLIVYDRDGREIQKLDRTDIDAVWDGRNNRGEIVVSGVYTVVLKADNVSKRKVVVVK